MVDRSQPARSARPDPHAKKPSKLAQLRQRFPSVDRLVRAGARYQRQYGDYYAAAVTFFSVLALVPLLMVGFAIAGFVLSGNPDLLEQLKVTIAGAIPDPGMSALLNSVISEAIRSAGAVGLLGLVVGLYSGLGWMTKLREALTAQWSQQFAAVPILRRLRSDLLALFGLGLAMGVSFGISALGGGIGEAILRALGVHEVLGRWVFHLPALVVSVAAGWLVFLWVLARLPRKPVSWRSAVWGALFAALGFEVLKQIGVVYLSTVTRSPSGAAFGPILGLLVFANLTSRFILFVAAWTASAAENLEEPEILPPGPAVIRPVVNEERSARRAVGWLSLGVLSGALLRYRLRNRRWRR